MLSENERAKKSGIAVVNGVTYAVGLMWEPADDPEHAMKEAYVVAKSEDVQSDFLCLRLSTPPQYGLGWKTAGHFSGIRPLAVTVTENVGGNYIGVFKLGNKWWLGMSKNDIILPYGDLFYSTEEEAKSTMNRLLPDLTSDTIKFAPKEWSIPGAKDTPLDVLITSETKIKLSPVDSLLFRSKNLILTVAIIGIASWFIYGYFSNKIKEERELKEKRRAKVEQAKNIKNSWISEPAPDEFLTQCLEGIYSMPFNMSGWSITNLECNGNTVKAYAVKNGGYIYDLENKSKNNFDLTIDAEGKNAVLVKQLESLPVRSNPASGEDLLYGDRISQQLLDLGSKIGVNVQLSGVSHSVAQPRTMVDENGEDIVLPPIYTPVSFSFFTGYSIEEWKDYLAAFPALEINTLKLNITSDMSWGISGDVYQK